MPHSLRLPRVTLHQPSSQTAHRDPALDGLRGIAVLMVFLFHYGGGLKSPHLAVRLLGYLTAAGWTGVVLFFTLSGFLITGSLWDSRGNPHWFRNFYARRFLRIFPLYYTALVLSAIGLFVAWHNLHLLHIPFGLPETKSIHRLQCRLHRSRSRHRLHRHPSRPPQGTMSLCHLRRKTRFMRETVHDKRT